MRATGPLLNNAPRKFTERGRGEAKGSGGPQAGKHQVPKKVIEDSEIKNPGRV